MDKLIIDNIKTILQIDNNNIVNLKRFSKGMSNYTYYFEANNEKYVIRIIGEGAEKYVDYYNELNAILLINSVNLTSDLIYFDPITGTKLAKYIDGNIYEFTHNKDLTKLIKSLKSLHSLKADYIQNYELINRLNKYESFNNDLVLDTKFYELKEWLINEYNNKYINEPLVFCHNDLQDANIIETKDEVYLIDFEYAAYNDIYYDIASFEEDAYLVYESYFDKKIDTVAKNHINFYKMYQSLQWYLVAFYKESIGFSEKTSYNFKDLADYFLNTAIKMQDNIIKGI